MGCSASQSAAVTAAPENDDEGVNKPIPPPTTFEISMEEGDSVDSLIKKHPPKRLEERLTKQLSPPQTISDLCDKLASAELRRQSILRDRVNNIRNNLKQKGVENEDFIEEEEEPERIADLPDSEDKSETNAN